MTEKYQVTDKVRSVIANDYRLLQVMSRFGISLGFGEKTIREVCRQQDIDPDTCVEVLNFVCDGGQHPPRDIDRFDVGSLLIYLRKTHSYFLDYLFPTIRRSLLSSIDCSMQNEVAFLMLKFYDEYVEEVRQHMNYEEEVSFSYVDELLEGKWNDRLPDGKRLLSAHHEEIDKRLQELKNLFVQYYPQQGTSNELNAVLYELYRAQEDLETHCMVEDQLFSPAVRHLETRVQRGNQMRKAIAEAPDTDESEALSAREKDIVVCVAKGMANKEIADKLCLSINTVTTHRRNIARKLQIHSSAGITIYAIVNKLVTLEEGVHMV